MKIFSNRGELYVLMPLIELRNAGKEDLPNLAILISVIQLALNAICSFYFTYVNYFNNFN